MTTVAGALLPQSPGRRGPLRCESALRSASLFRDSSLNPPRDTKHGFILHTLAAGCGIKQRLVERVCPKSRTSHPSGATRFACGYNR
jgi:hypothetical protein